MSNNKDDLQKAFDQQVFNKACAKSRNLTTVETIRKSIVTITLRALKANKITETDIETVFGASMYKANNYIYEKKDGESYLSIDTSVQALEELGVDTSEILKEVLKAA